MQTQKQFLVKYLRGTGRTITSLEAKQQFDISNLRARISELRSIGFRVASRKNEHGAAVYTMSSRLQNGSRATVEV